MVYFCSCLWTSALDPCNVLGSISALKLSSDIPSLVFPLRAPHTFVRRREQDRWTAGMTVLFPQDSWTCLKADSSQFPTHSLVDAHNQQSELSFFTLCIPYFPYNTTRVHEMHTLSPPKHISFLLHQGSSFFTVCLPRLSEKATIYTQTS